MDGFKTEPKPDLRLHVVDGNQTKPEHRPGYGRLLIGASVTCDVRLSGSAIPAVHSIIDVSVGEIIVSACVNSPPLLLNGEVIKSERLVDGDLLEIDDARILCRTGMRHAAVAGLSADQPKSGDDITGVAHLSAEELVDQLDHQMNMVERQERTKPDGVRELLHAALRKSAAHEDSSADAMPRYRRLSADESPHSPQSQERANARLSAELAVDIIDATELFAKQVSKQHQSVSRRLDSLTGAIESLVQQQTVICGSVEALRKQMEERAAQEPALPRLATEFQRRASA